jgi:hypothetical protein
VKYSPFSSHAAATLVSSVLLGACASVPPPQPVHHAEQVAESQAAVEARKYAPQAHASAEKYRAEANFLHNDGRQEEAAAAGDQALAAYSEAFALARIAKAEEKLSAAQAALSKAEQNLAHLDQLQTQISADADAFELRARVHLDSESLQDVDNMSAERSKARQQAARQLAAEAGLLCLATRLLDGNAPGLVETKQDLEKLEKELSFGSIQKDIYPRAAALRSECLKKLTIARRSEVTRAPDSAASDRLFKELTDSGKVFAYRDDRGVVVNLGGVLDKNGSLTEASGDALRLLGATAKMHPAFPLMLVVHSVKHNDEKQAQKVIALAQDVLTAAGAPSVTPHSVGSAQPIVNPRLDGAEKKNERIEIVFVVSGR